MKTVLLIFSFISVTSFSQTEGASNSNYETKYGIGTNITISNFFHSGKITPYLFYRTKRHHFGLGPMIGRKLLEKINDFGFGSLFTLGFDPNISISGLQAHYRYFIYPPQKRFDLFLEGQISNTFIKQTTNGESTGLGSAFQFSGGLGFRFKITDFIALTQTTFVGIETIRMSPNNIIQIEPLRPEVSLGVAIGLEFSIF